MNREMVRELVEAMQSVAYDQFLQERGKWPHVSDRDFRAVARAIGEISVDEARAALDEWEQQKRAHRCRRG